MMAKKAKFRVVRDTWITTFAVDVIEARLLYLIGTKGRAKWVPVSRYKDGDRVRVTIEKLPQRGA